MMQWIYQHVLGLKDATNVTYFEWHLRSPWPSAVAALLVAAAIAFAVWLYRRQGRVGRPKRVALGVLRAAILALIVLMLFEPVFGVEMEVKLRRLVIMLVDTSESMQVRDQREREADLREAAMATGRIAYDDAAPGLSVQTRQDVGAIARVDLAKAVLTNADLGLLRSLDRDHKVQMFTFDDTLEAVSVEQERLADSVPAIEATGQATRLGGVIEEAIGRYAGQPIAGVVVLTDGGANKGVDVLDTAKMAGGRGVPIFPVGIGLPDPPDVVLKRVIGQEIVFPEDRVPVRVQVQSTGYAGQMAELVLRLDDREVARQGIVLNGGTQFEQTEFIPGEQQTGTRRLTVEIAPQPGETILTNNSHEQSIRIVDEKIKVLYIEGKPRWEYRYLRAVLLRDHRLDVKLLMTEGDEDLARNDPLYIDRFPVEAGEAFQYDLVIIGDVPAYFFTPMQIEKIEQLVRQHAGSLLMVAGRRFAPHTYEGTLLEKVLPVRLLSRPDPPTFPVRDDVFPVVTDQATFSTSVALEPDEAYNASLWSMVSPMYELPRLAGAKPGATVLLTLSSEAGDGDRYPLVAWQRYGSGKALFIGTDALWRLRFKRGDRYHAQFWRQTIQFLTLSRLLSGSKRITLETDRRSYNTGQRIAVYANVLNDVWEPVDVPAYTVYLEGGAEIARLPVKLEPVPDRPGLYQGFISADKAGSYKIAAGPEDGEAANVAEFDVRTVALEQRDPAMQRATLMKIAEVSGGRYFSLAELPELVGTLSAEDKTAVKRLEKDLWDMPAVYVLIVLLAGAEWYFRRRVNLV